MNKIEMGKTYTNRSGNKVRILCTDASVEKYPVVAEVHYSDVDIRIKIFTQFGECFAEFEPWLDLVEVSPYADWKIDDKIEVSDFDKTGSKWFSRHFAKIGEDGTVYAWSDGKTSHTADTEVMSGCITKWEFARKPV